MNAKQIWQTAMERLRARVDAAVFITWFQGASALSFENHIFTIHVPSPFTKSHLERRYVDLLQSVLSELTGEKVEIQIVVTKEAIEGQGNEDDNSDELSGRRVARSRRGRPSASQRERRIADAAASAMNSMAPLSPRDRVHVEPAELGELSEQPTVRMPRLSRLSYALNNGEHAVPEQHNHTTSGSASGAGGAGDATLANTNSMRRAGNEYEDDYVYPSASVESLRPSITLPVPEGLLNPRYTFETFIVGKSNKFAHAASLAVAEQPGRVYNPLFLYGGVGLGKTHLLHAVGHTGEAAGLNVLYVTSEKFTNEIINAIRFQKTEEFRAKYRQIDILLVDDIQFIAGKESTEEEFFHTFNTLHNANKQIVVTSDRPPKAIHSLQDRLRSRFEWGLLADVEPPEYEHRLAILRSKCVSLRFSIPAAVIEYIARPECSNVRELEGALNRVIAYATLHDSPITVSLAAKALEHLYNEADMKPHLSYMLTPAEVLEGVSRYYQVNEELVRGKQRGREIVWPRQVAMYLMREETSASLQQIGAELGGRDHTTIMYGWERVHNEMKNNDRVRQEIAAVLECIQRR